MATSTVASERLLWAIRVAVALSLMASAAALIDVLRHRWFRTMGIVARHAIEANRPALHIAASLLRLKATAHQ